MTAKTLFDAVCERGIEYGNHESDLYLPSTEETRQLVKDYGLCLTSDCFFRNQINGELWIDIPFQYTPWWEAKFRGRSSTPS